MFLRVDTLNEYPPSLCFKPMIAITIIIGLSEWNAYMDKIRNAVYASVSVLVGGLGYSAYMPFKKA